MLRYLSTLFMGIWLSLALSGCQTTTQHGFNAEQIAVLKAKGFRWTDEGWALDLASKVLFETDSEEISSNSRKLISDISRALLSVGLDRVTLEGHTDDQGSAAYNQKLSMRRAETVAEVMLASGLQRKDLTLRAMGQSHPIADNNTAQGRSENRRVAIIVSAQ